MRNKMFNKMSQFYQRKKQENPREPDQHDSQMSDDLQQSPSPTQIKLVTHTPEEELNLMKEETYTAAHFHSPKQLQLIYTTNILMGLTESMATEIFNRIGPNKLRALKGNSHWKILRQYFFGWFQCILWLGAIINFLAFVLSSTDEENEQTRKQYLYLSIVISGTVIGTGFFSFYHESKNLATIRGFEHMIPSNAVVVRDGTKKKIPNDKVVVGDIVEMTKGQTVPADIRVLECTNFRTNMASLTDGLIPVSHTTVNTNANALESKNMAYFTCPITESWAKGLVVETGELTQIGKIAGLVTGLQKEQSPLSKEIDHFLKLICGLAFFFGFTLFVTVYIVHKNWLSALTYMLGIILANVPECWLVTLTVCMTLSANELKKKNCLTKTLRAVQTLGSTSCICCDKTGTLTQNKMTVSHLFSNFTIIDEEDHSNVSDPVFTQLCFAACLNLKANFAQESMDKPIDRRNIFGDASESAILRYMEANRSATKVRKNNPKIAEIPFSSDSKYQITIHEVKDNIEYYLIMKGAPEIILDYCSTVMYTCTESQKTTLKSKNMSPLIIKELKGNFIKLSNMGERMIGYAIAWLPAKKYPKGFKFDTKERNFSIDSLQFVGVISMIDPARAEVPRAISKCRDAGIKVTMITGDHPATALAISRKVGIITQPTAFDYAYNHHIDISNIPAHIKSQFSSAVVTGEDMRKMSTQDLRRTIQTYSELTFARTSPQQKLLIVETYQALHHVVAFTGDGVNDSPALKKADIGISMGITGTDVSKQASDMILLDDNFASIIKGIEEGRFFFNNLRKTIAFTLTSNTPEMMPFVLNALLGIPLPLTLMLIMVINVGTDVVPAVSLAYETPESDIMHMPPRKPNEHLVTKQLLFMAYFQIGLIEFFAAMYAYLFVFAEAGFYPSSLLFIREKWETHKTVIEDSFGQTWFYYDRETLERRAQTAYFVAICWMQISNVIICKTRRISLYKKGMKNYMLNVGIAIELLVAVVVTYMPLWNQVLGTLPLAKHEFFLALPFMAFMILGDEVRRYIIRNGISPWMEQEMYY